MHLTGEGGTCAARAVRVEAWKPDRGTFEDRVTAEVPLEIRVDGVPVAVTLRTPGDDEELAAGFVYTEGLAGSADEIVEVVRRHDVPPDARGNVVDVRLAPPRSGPETGREARRPPRPRFITASCGACGRGTIDAIRRRVDPLRDSRVIAGCRLTTLPDRLRASQEVFDQTGGIHAAGLFDADGALVVAREDIGRHNAVDKIVGWGVARRRLPFTDAILIVSGRAGFEIVLKAWVAGIPIVASISAPSELAIQLAEEANLTLVGFLRGESYSVYAGRQRLAAG